MTSEDLARTVCRHVIRMCAYSESSHLGSALSIVDVLSVLYSGILKIDPSRPQWCDRDRFILSKAHGGVALVSVLAELGFFPKSMLAEFYVDGGLLPGHLDKGASPGVEFSTGSLGHGLGFGIGKALALKAKKSCARVFVLVGDGECNEGSIWEAILLAPRLKLNNLTLLVDRNGLQSFGRTEEIIPLTGMEQALLALGWDARAIPGHDHKKLEECLGRSSDSPRCFILNTVKGKGVSFMEDRLEWHYRSPRGNELERALAEIGGDSSRDFVGRNS